MLWAHWKLPTPTDAQLAIARRLQFGADGSSFDPIPEADAPRRDVIRCFRSLGKSYLTAAYVAWRLARNPRDEKVLVLSASRRKAQGFVDQVKGILRTFDLFSFLLRGPKEGGTERRDMAQSFDVAGASPSQSFSLSAQGVSGQVTGERSTLIIPDDIETRENSKTENGRADLMRLITSDLIPIAATEHGLGDIILLGTPQGYESLYNRAVIELGFTSYCIPLRWPTSEKIGSYVLKGPHGPVELLAGYLRERHAIGELSAWDLTDTRFDHVSAIALEARRSDFLLQYMLDTELADADRYPLKLKDLVVFSCNPLKAPMSIQWGRHNDRRNVISDIPNLGFTGDYLVGPLFVDDQWRPYDQIVQYIDPSGSGEDETAWAIIGSLMGSSYLLKVGAVRGDPDSAQKLAAYDAISYRVTKVEIEPNYAKGVWILGYRRHYVERRDALAKLDKKTWGDVGASIEEGEWARGQKEERILGVLEPALSAHRLVVDEELLREDLKNEGAYSLMWQLTHLTRDRGSLRHDDRLEAVAGALVMLLHGLERQVGEEREARIKDEKAQVVERVLQWAERAGNREVERSAGRVVRAASRDLAYLYEDDYEDGWVLMGRSSFSH